MTEPTPTLHPLPIRNRVGLGLCVLLGLFDVAGLALAPGAGDIGPPFAVVVFSFVMGLVTLAAALPAWRTGDRRAVLAVAVSRALSGVTAIPAFFVGGVPAAGVTVAAVGLLLTVVAVVLLLLPAPHRGSAVAT